MRLSRQVKLLLVCGLLLAMALVLAACGGSGKPAQEQQQPAQEQQQQPAQEQQPAPEEKKTTGEAAAGDKVAAGQAYFQANGCAGCHAIAGQGGSAAPDLSKAGSKYDVAGVKDFLKSKHPMPFQGSDDDLEAVAQYLASLK